MIDIITNPEDFFRTQAREGTLKAPGIVLILTGLAFAMQHIGTYYALGTSRTQFTSVFSVLFTVQLLEPLFLWLVFTISFYLIAWLLGGDVLIGRLFRLSGWGFLPLVLTGIVWTGGRYFVLQSASVPEFNRGVLEQELNAYGEIVAQHSEPLAAIFLLGSVFMIASIYLWIHAIRNSGTVTTKTAAISVVVPVVGYVVYRVQDLLVV